MNNRIMVTLSTSGGFIGLSTYSKSAGRHGRFLFGSEFLRDILSDGKTRHDSDCGSYATIYRAGETVIFRIAWLSGGGDGRVSGIRQTVRIPAAALMDIVDADDSGARKSAKLLSIGEPGTARVVTAGAMSGIRRVQQNERKRRALSKALRDCFRWPGDVVQLYSDGGDDFAFSASDGIVGGLVLHNTGRGYRYEVHT